jgi:hypothetical protein
MKRFKLNEAIASYDSFLKVNETEVSATSNVQTSTPTSTISEPKVDSEYVSNLSAEIDTIINGLKDLAVQLEPVEESEDNEKLYEGALIDTFFQGDPLFPLLAGGIGAILGILGLSIKAVKDSKRNAKIGTQVEGDYNKLKTLKLQEVRLQAAVDQLKMKQDAFKADTNQPDDEENRMATNDADPRLKAAAGKIKVQLQTVQKKKDDVATAATEFQTHLEEKYNEENLKGFFSGKVRRVIAIKKNEIASEVAQLKLKLAADEMDPEEKAKLEETIKSATDAMKKSLADAKAEAEESEKKIDANAEKIAGELDKKITKLTQLKDSQEGDEAIKTEMKIVGLKMQKAKVQKDNEKVDLFKGKLAELRKKLGGENPEDTTDSEEETPAEETPDDTEKIAALDKEIETLTASKEGKEGSEANDIEKQILGKKIAKAKMEDNQEEITKLTKELDDLRKSEVTDQEPGAEKNSKDDKLQRIDDLIKKEEEKIAKNPSVEKAKAKVKEYEDAIDTISKKEKKDKSDQDKIDMLKNAIDAEKKKMEKDASSDNLKKLKDLKDKISAKESWQLEGTELGRIFEMEIKKFEAMYMLNEGFSSIKDKFSQLL